MTAFDSHAETQQHRDARPSGVAAFCGYASNAVRRVASRPNITSTTFLVVVTTLIVAARVLEEIAFKRDTVTGSVFNDISLVTLFIPPTLAATTRSAGAGVAFAVGIAAIGVMVVALTPEPGPQSDRVTEHMAVLSATALTSLIGGRVLGTQRSLRRTNQHLELMRQNGDTLINSPRPRDALVSILARLVDSLPTRLAAVRLSEPDGLYCFPPGVVPLERGRDAVVAPTEASRFGETSAPLAAFPIVVAGRQTGVLWVEPASSRLGPQALSLLEITSEQIGSALAQEAWGRAQQAQAISFGHQMLAAQEEERRRIARDLHDQTAQELTALVRHLDEMTADKPDALAGLRAARQLARESLAGVRQIAQDLRPTLLDDLGLCAAIEQLTADVSRWYSGEVELGDCSSNGRLDSATELALYRIAQEAMQNAAKHAPGRRMHVNVGCLGSDVSIEVADNGPGFDVQDALAHGLSLGKLGLAGMFERAELAGLRLSVDSRPGEGTTVRVSTGAGAAAGASTPAETGSLCHGHAGNTGSCACGNQAASE